MHHSRNRTLTFTTLALTLGSLIGCGMASTATTTPDAGSATVNLTVSDTPPTAVTILSFQVQIASAVLQPGNVSLVPKPVTVDLSQLATDTGFLASTVIGSATYTSLTLTLADPQVTLMNNTGAALNLNGQTCAAAAVCTYTPALDTASLTLSSGVFPLTVSASSSTGLNLDLSIPDLLQSDLSITLANGNAVNLSLLGKVAAKDLVAPIAGVFASVTSVNGDTVQVTTAFSDTLILTTSPSTTYTYPSTVCSSTSASCLATGQSIVADLSLLGDGSLAANAISFAGAPNLPAVKGLILSTDSASTRLLIQRQLNAPNLTIGQIATLSVPSGTAFAIGAATYPTVTGATFAAPTDLLTGQELVANLTTPPAASSTPALTSSALFLEPSQVLGQVASLDASDSSATLNALSGLFTDTQPLVEQVSVQAGSSTTYTGFSVTAFSALNTGALLSAKGLLFNTTAITGSPTLAAQQLHARNIP
jgi:hypothetical protein